MSEENELNLFAEKIEWMAIQYGLSPESSFQITKDSLRFMGNQQERLDLTAYRKALEEIGKQPDSELHLKEAFPFKEDYELHSAIVNLEKEIRMPLILFSFHQLTYEEIATVLTISIEQVEQSIETAHRRIGGEQLEKRLALLGKSYARIPTQFMLGQSVRKVASPKVNSKKSKRTKWLIAAGIVLIGILITTSFLSNKGETIHNLKNEYEIMYEEARHQRQGILQLSDARFSKLGFIQQADKEMEELVSRSISDDETKTEFERLIEQLKLPSEMVEDVVETPLNEDEEGSIAFLNLFRNKVQDLIQVYDELVWDYREEIEQFESIPPEQKGELMMLSQNNFSEELQNVIDSMGSNSIKFCLDTRTGRVQACYYESKLHHKMQNQFHANTVGYVYLLASDSVDLKLQRMIGAGNEWNQEDILLTNLFYLQEAQKTLVNVEKDANLYPDLETYFVTLLNDFMKNTEVFDDQGRVLNILREKWSQLPNYYAATPMDYLILPILTEMEKAGWQKTERWERLTQEKIIEALEMARSEKLEEVMYGEKVVVPAETIDLSDISYQIEVEKFYKEFKTTNNLALLDPILLVGVFDYANEMEDFEAMFHLSHLEDVPIEEYIESWQREISLFEGALTVEVEADELLHFGNHYYTNVKITYEKNPEKYISVLLEKDGSWRVWETKRNPLNSSGFANQTAVEEDFMKSIETLYEHFAYRKNPKDLQRLSPIEIVGIYLQAARFRDFATQYQLIDQEGESRIIDKIGFVNGGSEGSMGMIGSDYNKSSFGTLYQSPLGNWIGSIELTVDPERNLGIEPVKTFPMIWSENGWRILYMEVD